MFGHTDKFHEECGVMAVYRKTGSAAELVHRGLFALQHRGQEAAGIASTGPEKDVRHIKGRGLVSECLPTYKITSLTGDHAIGHVRYSTVPADRSENIQPFVAMTPFGSVAIAHNGNLKNTEALRAELEAAGSLMSTSMDTELLVHLMARSSASNFFDALRFVAKKAVGAYSLALLCDGKLYGLRDPNGVRPLVLGSLMDGWVIASETCALSAVGATYLRDINPGELVELSPEGPRSTQLLTPGRPSPCVFELVYFARPDSKVFGQGVHGARIRMGEELARQDAEQANGQRADLVVPVPDSGVPAAIGYSRQSGIPFSQAILRSHYVGRTFILPNQDARTHSIHLKLSVVSEAVEGKRVVLVDDSLVRGNTSKQIVQMMRDAGAKEVWMRIASPPLSWPCYLGIDTPTREELIINRQGSVDAVGAFIGADNLRYLSLAGLQHATQEQPFCFGCMSGDYPL